MIDTAELAEVVDRYLTRFPEERDRLTALLTALDNGNPITDRNSRSGHLTCSAIVLDPQGRVLHIRHNTLDTWLRPGGHVEPQDASLPQAALRELHEETGIPATMVHPIDATTPLDIDVDLMPTDPARGEPEHRHFDLHYAFTIADSPPLTLQVEEVSAYQWISVHAIVPVGLRDKVIRLLSQ
jgi:8-oxo-dGTP pyrophosphatase MutT (NUDIX family)